MKRDPQALASRRFDVAVVGGGVHGLAIARDAALRGLDVALLERDDFASATSMNSLKIVHGGLRYLQHGDFRRMRQSIHERRILLATAPHLVRPLPCLMPTSGRGVRSRAAMAAALLLNDLVGFDRNRGVDPLRRLPRGRILPPAACRNLVPAGLPAEITGGALWYDAQMLDSERLALAILHSAWNAGALALNRVAVTGLLQEGATVVGVQARDRMNGDGLEVRARLVINAAGPWAPELAAGAGHGAAPLSLALNLVLRRSLVKECALAISSRVRHPDPHVKVGGQTRLLFLTPWQDRCIVGTTHEPYHGDAADFQTSREQVQRFLDEINAACPEAALHLDDVALVHAGLLPAEPPQRGESSGALLAKHARLLDHRRLEGRPGLLTVMGVKWTTAREVAARAVDLAFRLLGQESPPCATATTPLAGGDIPDLAGFLDDAVREGAALGLAPPVARRLAGRYGTLYREVVAEAAGKPHALRPLADGTEVLGVEVLYARRREMALDLTDVVRRRTGLGSGGPPSAAALAAAAHLLSGELGWSEDRRRREVEAILRMYPAPW